MVKQAPVSIGWQTAMIFIPYAWIYAFYRIEKLRFGLVLVLINAGIDVGIQVLLTWLGFPPYSGLAVGILVSILLPVRFIRKWSREWNSKFSSTTP